MAPPVPSFHPPALVAHCDWGTDPNKRWMARAVVAGSGGYAIQAPELVGELKTFLDRLRRPVGPDACILVGFDFPIGLPKAYALPTGIETFPEALRTYFGHNGAWMDFYQVCDESTEIRRTRPFYPRSAKKKGDRKKEHLTAALGVSTMRELFRRCERATDDRGSACCLFWTLGGNQVGKAAISGWQDVLAPALRETPNAVRLWPFDGDLQSLLLGRQTVLAETYPTEAYRHLEFPADKSNKQSRAWREARSREILAWVERRPVQLSDEARGQVMDGFGNGKEGEDRFDALVGLCSMLDVVLGYRDEGAPLSEDVRKIEGWILGQRPETDMPIQVLGYSERGFFNSLFFCLRYHPRGGRLLQKLLDRARWPALGEVRPRFGNCETLLVEQSFSDFGDADAVLLLRTGGQLQSLFIEGKRGDYRLTTAWSQFRGCFAGESAPEGLTSNLFSQLYLKQRLAAALAPGGDWMARLQTGLPFAGPLQTNRKNDRLRKIGSNPVVLEATRRLQPFAADAYFLALVPESLEQASQTWHTLKDCPIDGWDVRRWGFLSLPEVSEFCHEHALADVIDVLRFNRGQLFA